MNPNVISYCVNVIQELHSEDVKQLPSNTSNMAKTWQLCNKYL